MRLYNLPVDRFLLHFPGVIPVKKITRAGLAFLLPVLYSIPLTGQDTLDFTTFLVSRMVIYEQLNTRQEPTWKPAWINDIEVRTETDRFDPDRQEYLARFNFNSFGLMKAQKNYHAALKEQSTAGTTELLGEFMQKSYEDWLEAVFTQKIHTLLLQKRTLLEDELRVRQKIVETAEKDLDKYLDLKNEIREEDLRLQAVGFQLKTAVAYLTPAYAPQPYVRINEQLLPVEQIEAFVNRLATQKNPVNPIAENSYQTRLNTLENEQAIEQAESRQVVNFVQLRYRGPHDEEFDERLSASIGLRIPLNGRNRLKTAELNLEIEALKQKKELDEYALSRSFTRILGDIRLLLDQYRLLRQQSENLQVEYEMVVRRVNTSSSPVWLLDLQKNLNKTSLRQLEVSAEIYESYLALLALTGRFRHGDILNYLHQAPDE